MNGIRPNGLLACPEKRERSVLGWGLFWKQLLGQAGALLLLGGIICFFAFNWADMPAFAKFGVISGCMLLAAAFPLAKGLDHFAGSAGLLLCGLLAGPLLAVFGQVYQTGADAWELFRAWSLFLIPLALLGRQTGLWCVAGIVNSLWGTLWLVQMRGIGMEIALRYPPFLLGKFAFLFLWELGTSAELRGLSMPGPLACLTGSFTERSFLSSRWLPRLLGASILSLLTWTMLELASSHYVSIPLKGIYWSSCYVLFLTAGGWWYAKILPDTFMHALGLFSLSSVLLTWVLTRLFVHAHSSYLSGRFFLAALLLAACGAVVGKALLVLHKKNEQTLARLQDRRAVREGGAFGMSARVWLTWRAFRLAAGMPEQTVHRGEAGAQPSMPWYSRLFVGLCAWVASFLLVGFFGFLFSSNFLHEGMILGSLVFFPLGLILERCQGLFPKQFGLTLLLAGAACFTLWLCYRLDLSDRDMPLAVAAVCLLTCPLARSEAYRCLSAFLCFCLLPCYAGLLFPAFDAATPQLYLPANILAALLYLSFCLGLACLWRLRHTPSPRFISWQAVLRPFAYGAFAALLVLGGLTAAGFSRRILIQLDFHSLSFIGSAAGFALVYFAVRLSGDLGLAAATRLGAVLAALGLTILAWWLPWVGVGFLALALARQAGSLPLQGLGLAFLAVCLNWEYYNLDRTLLFKSLTLCALGLLCLFLAFLMSRLLNNAIRAGRLPGLEKFATGVSGGFLPGDSAQTDAAVQGSAHA